MSFAERDGVIWLDGDFIEWRKATTHVLTHSLHYGLGVFEGVRAYASTLGTALFRVVEHTERLFESAHIVKMQIPYTQEKLVQVQKEVVHLNHLKSAYIRPLCFYGAEGMGLRAENLKTHVMVAAWEWGSYLGKEYLEKGIKVHIASFMRSHSNSSMSKAKVSGQYINSILALQEALACGCQEALLLDPQGFVAEGSGENFFMVRHGILVTPPLTSCLAGITRATIISLASEKGLPVQERFITRDEAYCAEEAFFTGSAAEVTPIREIDGRTIGSGTRGPITTQLQQAYFDSVNGRTGLEKKWLTPVL